MRQAQALGERLGNEGCLIVSAFSLALPVEGYGHDNIGSESLGLARHHFDKPVCEPATKGFDLFELQ